MSTPWPDNVFDCALRLARSLGYREIHIWPLDGRVYVYCPKGSRDWRELDPRDPTVWSALLGVNKVYCLEFFASGECVAAVAELGIECHYNKHPGMAICEAYNLLKGHPRRGNE